ncbi:MAG: hypothetical protein K2O24_00820 [Muribaculaceae bacterium]|nr:hypothetical protein [Muribaculaceae bacterium]
MSDAKDLPTVHSHSADCRLTRGIPAAPGDFNFENYARGLWERNVMAADLGFGFAVVSGASGLLDCLEEYLDMTALVAVSDESDASGNISAAPSLVRTKTIFFCMRHVQNDLECRAACMRSIRELQRQFLSRMLHDRNALACAGVTLIPQVDIHESDKYFFNGCAMSYMDIGYSLKSSMRYDPRQWIG